MATKTIRVRSEQAADSYNCYEAITPGMLCEVDSNLKMKKHATGGGSAARIFAVEDDDQGNDIDDAYTAANQGKFVHFIPGDRVYALLANGETAVKGSKLESNGDGYLRVVDSDASTADIGIQSVVGFAREALDMSDSSGADPASQRILIEIM